MLLPLECAALATALSSVLLVASPELMVKCKRLPSSHTMVVVDSAFGGNRLAGVNLWRKQCFNLNLLGLW